MHNRARLLAASFLVKDLLLPWQEGAAWFWDTLVDADLANNTLGWQWVAGCGADAAPYFRVFNPVTQGRRFDPDGAYVRRWVPELAGLAARARCTPRGWRRRKRSPAPASRSARPTRRRSSITARRACARSPPTTRGPRRAERRGAGAPPRAGQSSATISGTGRPSGPTVTSASVRGCPKRGLAGRAGVEEQRLARATPRPPCGCGR